MYLDEPVSIAEVREMSSAQLGSFLGELFGLRPGCRLVAERNATGEVEMVVEQIASRTCPASTCSEFRTAVINGGPLLRLPAGARPLPHPY